VEPSLNRWPSFQLRYKVEVEIEVDEEAPAQYESLFKKCYVSKDRWADIADIGRTSTRYGDLRRTVQITPKFLGLRS
jgi:hypothetical protein